MTEQIFYNHEDWEPGYHHASMIEDWVFRSYSCVWYSAIWVRNYTIENVWEICIASPDGTTTTCSISEEEFQEIPVKRGIKQMLERLRIRDYWVNDPGNRSSP